MPRKERPEEELPSIVVLYTSLMILLLAFFIMLNTMSKVEEAKVEAAYMSLVSTFGFTPGGLSPLTGAAGRGTPKVSAPMDPVDQDYMSLQGMSQETGLNQEVRFLRSGQTRTMVMPVSLLFKPGTMELTGDAKEFLSRVSQVLGFSEYPISLRGFTDDNPVIDPKYGDNWTVSAYRALAVLRCLVELGVKPGRLSAYGLGEEEPLVANDTPSHRAMNNRVEMYLNSNDVARYHVPEGGGSPSKIDFRGFVFDLFGSVPSGDNKKVGGQ